ELTADMAEPGFVVLGDTYYPGWQATIDGEKTPVYRANSIVRAVYVPAGQHTITFTFRPPDFIIGAFISGLTLFGSLWLWLRI
ncbi:MAG: YfhO family protein, partial [Chloroflexi bacterium]|nr:YfhO family protein [Chloroflexota bacterium]